jgi:ligand-binding SRPBCC domain-containing protein
MVSGALIDYRLQLFGVPFTWKTRIDSFEPMSRFVDRQLRGPYALWHHLHEFYEVEGGTLVVDQVDYRIGWSFLGNIAHATFVRRTLDEIFDYRRLKVAELLDTAVSPPSLAMSAAG